MSAAVASARQWHINLAIDAIERDPRLIRRHTHGSGSRAIARDGVRLCCVKRSTKRSARYEVVLWSGLEPGQADFKNMRSAYFDVIGVIDDMDNGLIGAILPAAWPTR